MTSPSAATGRYPVYVRVEGELPNGMRLHRPVDVFVEEDSGEYVASEQGYHMHGIGSNPDAAIEDFRQALADSYDMLSSDEESLGPQLREQLAFLRSIVACP